MSDHLVLSIDAISAAELRLSPYNNGLLDPNIYFKIFTDTNQVMLPTETIRAVIVPSGNVETTGTIGSWLLDQGSTDVPSAGIYYSKFKNETLAEKTITSLPTIKLDKQWENTRFSIHWVQIVNDNYTYDNNTSGTFSYPHNIQPNEVQLAGELIDSNTRIRYTVVFDEIVNADLEDYGTHDPYLVNVTYRYDSENTPVTGYFVAGDVVFNATTTYTGFGAGSAGSGIVFSLPFYDQRPSWKNVPAQYTLRLNNRSADCVPEPPGPTGSIPLEIPIDHQLFKENYLIDLDTHVSTELDPSKMRKVDEVRVDRNTIPRKRFSIGVKDISLKQNAYETKGIYISKVFSSDFDIYTFSLKVDEFIPKYQNTDPYSLVRYYVQFSGREWEPISPINRATESASDGTAIPKLLVLDRISSQSGLTNTKFLDYGSSSNIFRIKIAFDMSAIKEDNIISPEIRDYKCIIFDRNQMLDI